MARRFKITEEQRQYALKEGITITADMNAANGDVKKAVDDVRTNAEKSGINPNKVNVQIPANESKVYTVRELTEQRLMASKINSQVYSIRDFLPKTRI